MGWSQHLRLNGVTELGPEFFETGGLRRLCFLLCPDACLFFFPLCAALFADRLGTALERFAVWTSILFSAVCDLIDP